MKKKVKKNCCVSGSCARSWPQSSRLSIKDRLVPADVFHCYSVARTSPWTADGRLRARYVRSTPAPAVDATICWTFDRAIVTAKPRVVNMVVRANTSLSVSCRGEITCLLQAVARWSTSFVQCSSCDSSDTCEEESDGETATDDHLSIRRSDPPPAWMTFEPVQSWSVYM